MLNERVFVCFILTFSGENVFIVIRLDYVIIYKVLMYILTHFGI